MPDEVEDPICECRHLQSEHLEHEGEYFECKLADCECDSFRPAASDDAATAEGED